MSTPQRKRGRGIWGGGGEYDKEDEEKDDVRKKDRLNKGR